MGITDTLDRFITLTNTALNELLPYLGLAACGLYAIHYLAKNLGFPRRGSAGPMISRSRQRISHAVYLEVLLLIEISAFLLLFWTLPLALVGWTGWPFWPALLRWGIFFVCLLLALKSLGQKGQNRGVISASFHTLVLLLGWMADSWSGVLCLSFPILFIFYWTAARIAPIALPGHRDASPGQAWKKFLILVSYCWGVQRPLYAASDEAGMSPQKRIDGHSGAALKLPGMIWAPSHRVVGVTAGSQFKRVDGPGPVFTGSFERPYQAVDLRTHLWSSEIDVISRDGIGFKMRIQARFRIDPRSWEEAEYTELKRRNPLLRGGNSFQNRDSCYRYAPARVVAAISTTGTQKNETDPLKYWDDWVAGTIAEATRNRISELALDDLWHAPEDQDGQSAQHQIAQDILHKARPSLIRSGVELEHIRIDQLIFRPEAQKKLDEITSRHLNSWSGAWEQKRSSLLADAQTVAERVQQEARTFAESELLSAMAEGLEKTQKMHPGLPRYVIAVRFLGVLQDYLHPGNQDAPLSERDHKLEQARNFLGQLQQRLTSMRGEGKG